ncbi:MAG: hypothetical protein CW342_03045 [Thermoactinomycetaceae bacterium]|nr:hypothetical protein [Thermoactinomycetaceae bacterium]
MSTAATETGETPAKHRYDERDRRLVLARVGVSVGALLIGAIAGLPQVMERAAGSGFPRGSTRKMGKAVRRVRAIPFISGGKAGPGRTIPGAALFGPPLAEEAGNPPGRGGEQMIKDRRIQGG